MLYVVGAGNKSENRRNNRSRNNLHRTLLADLLSRLKTGASGFKVLPALQEFEGQYTYYPGTDIYPDSDQYTVTGMGIHSCGDSRADSLDGYLRFLYLIPEEAPCRVSPGVTVGREDYAHGCASVAGG